MLNSGYDRVAAAVQRSVDGLVWHVPYRNEIALKRPHSAIRIDNFKLWKFQDDASLFLFDVTDDLGERENLLDGFPIRAQKMDSILGAYLKEVHAPKWQEGITWKQKPLSDFNSKY